MSKGLLIISLVFVGIGCGNQNSFKSRIRQSAPRGKADVGVLLQSAKAGEVEALLKKHPAAQVRILNEAHGLYEIFGVDEDTVAGEIGAPVSRNEFFELVPPAQAQVFSVPAPDGLSIPGLQPCKSSAAGPRAVLTVAEPQGLEDYASVEMGKPIRLDASASAAADKQKLSYMLVVMGPSGSRYKEELIAKSALDLEPDALGLYQIALVVQDDKAACAIDIRRMVVTANRKFTGKSNKEWNVDLNKITHLKGVSAADSWQLSTGRGITIAIVDTGVNYNHPTLAGNILLNEKEIADNGVDDDGNGFKDDVLGYDFVNADGMPYDDDGHGTHVAGLAASRQFGMAKNANLLVIKGLNSVGGDIGTVAAAIRYAVDRGANVVNLSLGLAAPLAHPALASAVAYAESKGVLIVAAAGNGDPQTGLGFDIDLQTVFPASLANENLLTVTAYDKDNVLTSYANYGAKSVDVVAPGGMMPADPMISAAYENPKGGSLAAMVGTSMACPVVSGIAAQVLALRPTLTPKEVRAILLKAGTEKPELKGITVSGRHINAVTALSDLAATVVSF